MRRVAVCAVLALLAALAHAQLEYSSLGRTIDLTGPAVREQLKGSIVNKGQNPALTFVFYASARGALSSLTVQLENAEVVAKEATSSSQECAIILSFSLFH